MRRARLPLPSGRTAALVYDHGRVVRAAVKLQELFGLAETPRIGPRRDPVVFELLAPNGRPVQTTQDLRSFWTTTYAEVRTELRARYPRHPWPEDPWTATPTHRARPELRPVIQGTRDNEEVRRADKRQGQGSEAIKGRGICPTASSPSCLGVSLSLVS